MTLDNFYRSLVLELSELNTSDILVQVMGTVFTCFVDNTLI